MPSKPAVGGDSEGSVYQTFSAKTLGQYLRSHEDVSGVPKCLGVVRPFFEWKTAAANAGAFSVQPGAPPGRSLLWLFTRTKLEIPAGACVALG